MKGLVVLCVSIFFAWPVTADTAGSGELNALVTEACDYLGANGFTNCHVLEGGINEWMALGKPVMKGQHRLSLEGQVRAIAGGMILIGVALGFTVHSGFFLLPAIVGAGLLHAGLTDSCLMGLLLSKLPMNRIGNSRSAQEKKGDSL